MMFFLSRIVFCNHSLKIFLHSCDSIGRWRELASYLGPAMLAHLYMRLSELVMRGSEEKKNGKKS